VFASKEGGGPGDSPPGGYKEERVARKFPSIYKSAFSTFFLFSSSSNLNGKEEALTRLHSPTRFAHFLVYLFIYFFLDTEENKNRATTSLAFPWLSQIVPLCSVADGKEADRDNEFLYLPGGGSWRLIIHRNRTEKCNNFLHHIDISSPFYLRKKVPPIPPSQPWLRVSHESISITYHRAPLVLDWICKCKPGPYRAFRTDPDWISNEDASMSVSRIRSCAHIFTGRLV